MMPASERVGHPGAAPRVPHADSSLRVYAEIELVVLRHQMAERSRSQSGGKGPTFDRPILGGVNNHRVSLEVALAIQCQNQVCSRGRLTHSVVGDHTRVPHQCSMMTFRRSIAARVRRVIELPQTDEAKLLTGQFDRHALADLFLRARHVPNAHFIDLPLEWRIDPMMIRSSTSWLEIGRA